MSLVRFPSNKRSYVVGIVAGVITCLGATTAGRLLVFLGLHADLTYLDDVLLGVLVAALVLFLHRHYEFERSEHEAKIAELLCLHEAIAEDLNVIASTTGNPALAEIALDASARIAETLATLPTVESILESAVRPRVRRPARRLA